MRTTRQGPQVSRVEIRTGGDSSNGSATLMVGNLRLVFPGQWIFGDRWQRFGLYNSQVCVRNDGAVLKYPAHAGELVPGGTEDLEALLGRYNPISGRLPVPMTLDLDPTNRCMSRDCGGRCFSAAYRTQAPGATINGKIIETLLREFAVGGGKVVRFDGGGEPLLHPEVQNGRLVVLAHELGIKTSILTSGDVLEQCNLEIIGAADCYLRVSLNAATEMTRQAFHGNRLSLGGILRAVERFARWLQGNNSSLPIGATFLLDLQNYRQVVDAARNASDSGISHFSVRRILGPTELRPHFSLDQLQEIYGLFDQLRELHSPAFRIFIPWRNINEPDLDPSRGDYAVTRCWQAIFRTVIEPASQGDGFSNQLCGRYRGSGLIPKRLPALCSGEDAEGWLDSWRRGFDDFEVSRERLPQICTSCIDRGFNLLLERLTCFLGQRLDGFQILHLYSTEPDRIQCWEPEAVSPPYGSTGLDCALMSSQNGLSG